MPTTPINKIPFKPKPKRRSTVHTRPDTRSLSNHKPDNGDDNDSRFDSFSSYMHHKNRKLRQQFTREFSKSPSSSSKSTSIFKSVVVWVNGHTNPSRLEIRRIMGMHAGRLETYLTSQVTHIVAANLAAATRLRLSNKSSTAPRVKLVSPQWITQSLAQQKRLPESQYPVPFMDNPNQTSLNSFFSPDSSNHKNKSPHSE